MEALRRFTDENIFKLLSKAQLLVKHSHVRPLGLNLYYVPSSHPEFSDPKKHPCGELKYIVEKNGETLTCNCPGFRYNNICSHVIAVMIAESRMNSKRGEVPNG